MIWISSIKLWVSFRIKSTLFFNSRLMCLMWLASICCLVMGLPSRSASYVVPIGGLDPAINIRVPSELHKQYVGSTVWKNVILWPIIFGFVSTVDCGLQNFFYLILFPILSLKVLYIIWVGPWKRSRLLNIKVIPVGKSGYDLSARL